MFLCRFCLPDHLLGSKRCPRQENPHGIPDLAEPEKGFPEQHRRNAPFRTPENERQEESGAKIHVASSLSSPITAPVLRSLFEWPRACGNTSTLVVKLLWNRLVIRSSQRIARNRGSSKRRKNSSVGAPKSGRKGPHLADESGISSPLPVFAYQMPMRLRDKKGSF